MATQTMAVRVNSITLTLCVSLYIEAARSASHDRACLPHKDTQLKKNMLRKNLPLVRHQDARSLQHIA